MFDLATFDFATFDEAPGSVTTAPSLDGGNGGKKKPQEVEAPKRRDPRLKPAFEQLAKRPTAPKAEPEANPLPPYRDPPRLAPASQPVPALDAHDGAVPIFEQIRRDIMDAMDRSDIERLLAAHDDDERDIADINDMLEIVD